MFTGIVQEVGILKERKNAEDHYQLMIEGSKVLEGVSKGDSLAVNGVCLTVVAYTDKMFAADVMPETLRATNLSKLKIGSRVNLEQAVRADGFFGGHLITGHVDGPGKVKKIRKEKNARLVEISIQEELRDYMVDKGSVALNGASLTIMKVLSNSFIVSLIPETWNYTNLNGIKVGDEINIETDLIAKYVFKMLNKDIDKQKNKSKINKNFLSENGFL